MSGAQAASGAGAVVRQGYLRKLKTMKKKFFVLRAETVDTSARLEYYESEKKFRAGSAPRRALPLKSCYNITRRLDLKQKHVIALFMREEQFCVVADSEPDLHAWLTSILKQHRNDDASEELLHPIQHVWQVSVQKKGLGASKNIVGLYNLCLTDKTLTLVKIKSQNNVISDLGIPERVEYSLKNIRRCGDSECFFYMEVGRQTSTGAGELWMLSDDSNIAQSMHSTIYHAMRNCAKETENERDHIVMPKGTNENPPPGRRSTYSDGKGRAGLLNEKAVCVGACIRQCVCAACAPDDSAAALAAYTPPAENQAPNNSLTDKEPPPRLIKHHRTVSLPTGCPLFQEPLKIVHERTRSAPLTGEEVDRAILEKAVSHSSCKAVNGTDIFAKKSQWSRRASTGTRLSKLSPAHSKNASTLRNRCDSMPSRASSTFDMERPPPRLADLADMDSCRDEPDSVEWHRTPRIPEEPDLCDTRLRDFSTSLRGSSVQHSRTSSMGVEDGGEGGAMGAGLGLGAVPDGYLPMAPAHETRSGLISASSGSLCSGTPSTDHRFSEYQLDPAMSHIVEYERPPRAYSVGSRPSASESGSSGWRHRAYSVGARQRAAPAPAPARPHPAASSSAPLLPRTPRSSIGDLMELDFSNNSPAAKYWSSPHQVIVARTPPTTAGFMERNRPVDEYVDMSPRNAGYVEMRPGDRSLTHGTASAPHAPHAAAVQSPATPLAGSLATPTPSTPEGYVEMNYGRAATRPIAISGARVAAPSASPPEARVCAAGAAGAAGAPPAECRGHRTPLGSGTIFPLSLDSPASPPELDAADIVFDDDVGHHPLTTVREISEEGGRRSAEPPSPACPACPPSPPYARLSRLLPRPGPGPGPRTSPDPPELSCNPLANKNIRMDSETRGACTNQATVVVSGGGAVSRFSAGAGAGARAGEGAPPPPPPLAAAPAPAGDGTAPLNYAALDLEVSRCVSQPAARTYTQIDFARSGDVHLHRAADST